jgi:hypothetical protein
VQRGHQEAAGTADVAQHRPTTDDLVERRVTHLDAFRGTQEHLQSILVG